VLSAHPGVPLLERQPRSPVVRNFYPYPWQYVHFSSFYFAMLGTDGIASGRQAEIAVCNENVFELSFVRMCDITIQSTALGRAPNLTYQGIVYLLQCRIDQKPSCILVSDLLTTIERSAMNKEDIMECAFSIRPYLTNLLGTEAEEIERNLASLLERADYGEKVDHLILHLLRQHMSTREWARRYIGKHLRDYQQTGGNSGLVRASAKYFCPHCGYSWVQQFAGERPPLCKKHGPSLIPVVTVKKE
jgi:rubrerythrin